MVEAGLGSSFEQEANQAEPERTRKDQVLEALRAALEEEFDVFHELEHGGMSQVYLGYEKSTGRHVAIKVLPPSLMMMEAGMARRFEIEARIAAQLPHRNIIKVYRARTENNLPFIVMEFVNGSLKSIIDKHGALDFEVVRQVLVQLCDALAFAHSKRVVHRDIKPGNILVDALNPDCRVILTDFGIASVYGMSGLTATGVLLGSPPYMSPEQWSGGGNITAQSDQYSLGVVAFQMLTGRLPFTGITNPELMHAHLMEGPPSILTLRPSCPPDVASIVQRMLAKDPSDRWPSLQEAMAALQLNEPNFQEKGQAQLFALARTCPITIDLPPPPASPAAIRPAAEVNGTRGKRSFWGWARRRKGMILFVFGATVLAIVALKVSGFEGRPALPVPGPSEVPQVPGPHTVPELGGVRINQRSVDLDLEQTTVLAAQLRDRSGSPFADSLRKPSWLSENPRIATVEARTGLVTPVGVGRTAITVRIDSFLDRIPIRILPLRAHELVLSAPESMTVGRTVRVGIRLRSRSGSNVTLTGKIEWQSVDEKVAVVSDSGVLTAIGPGSTMILASASGVSGQIPIRVTAAPRVEESPPPPAAPTSGGQPPPALAKEASLPTMVELQGKLGRLVRLINQKEWDELGKLYPAGEEERTRERFLTFLRTDEPRALNLVVSDRLPSRNGAAMTAEFRIEFEWRTFAGRRVRRAATYTGTFISDATGWKLHSFRLMQAFPEE